LRGDDVIDVRVEGNGPAVVLLHSAVADHRMWDEVVAPLSLAHTVIRYDMCGFGSSPAPTAPFLYTDELAAVLDKVGVSSAAVVGNSMGGGIALRFAAAHPDRVTHLVMLASGTPGWQYSAQRREDDAAEAAALESGDIDTVVQIKLDSWVRGPFRSWSPELEALAERISGPLRVALENDPAIDAHCQDQPADLGSVRAPSLIGFSDKDYPDFPEMAEHLASVLPNAKLVNFPGAGHLIPLEQPARTAEELARFLKGAA
jgi:pimeloyl-ACP methyl ester carboxylesterase